MLEMIGDIISVVIISVAICLVVFGVTYRIAKGKREDDP